MWKHFVVKDFESITEIENLNTVVEENSVAETNDFSDICVVVGGYI